VHGSARHTSGGCVPHGPVEYSHGSTGSYRVLTGCTHARPRGPCIGRSCVSRRLVAVVSRGVAQCVTSTPAQYVAWGLTHGYFGVLTAYSHGFVGAAREHVRGFSAPCGQPCVAALGRRNAVWRTPECRRSRVALWGTHNVRHRLLPWVLPEALCQSGRVSRGVGVYTCPAAPGGALHHRDASVCESRVPWGYSSVLTATIRYSQRTRTGPSYPAYPAEYYVRQRSALARAPRAPQQRCGRGLGFRWQSLWGGQCPAVHCPPRGACVG
jgi:hypothetical protein